MDGTLSPPSRGRALLALLAAALIASLLAVVPQAANASVGGGVAAVATPTARAAAEAGDTQGVQAAATAAAVDLTPRSAVVDVDYTIDVGGYWVTTAAGQVIPHDAPHHGDRPALNPGEQIAALAATRSGGGYWLFSDRGRVFTYGDAKNYGDLPTALRGKPLAGRVVDAVPTSSGNGYYMMGEDGGIFSFGDARFHGSIPGVLPPGRQLEGRILGLAPTPTDKGYWLVAEDGGIFSFGDAGFYGSVPGALPPGRRLDGAIIGMVAQGRGYLMVGADGGIFNFGKSMFHGSLPGKGVKATVAAVTTLPDLSGYLMVTTAGVDHAFGRAKAAPARLASPPKLPPHVTGPSAPAPPKPDGSGIEGGPIGPAPPAPPGSGGGGLPFAVNLGDTSGAPDHLPEAEPKGRLAGPPAGGTPVGGLPTMPEQAQAAVTHAQANFPVWQWGQVAATGMPAAVGRIYTSQDGVNWSGACTGTVIGRDQVITAAHCLYDWSNKPKNYFRFYPGLHGSKAPYGYVAATINSAWLDSSYFNGNHTGYYGDYAVIKFGLTYNNRHLQDLVGSFRVYANGDQYTQNRFTIGYPSEGMYSAANSHTRNAIGAVIPNPHGQCHGGACIPYYCWSPVGQFYNWESTGWWRSIGFGCYSSGGWSGGPIFAYHNNELRLVSVLSTGWNDVRYSCTNPIRCLWYGRNSWGPTFRYERIVAVWNAAQ